jgi:hypothetical protein
MPASGPAAQKPTVEHAEVQSTPNSKVGSRINGCHCAAACCDCCDVEVFCSFAPVFEMCCPAGSRLVLQSVSTVATVRPLVLFTWRGSSINHLRTVLTGTMTVRSLSYATVVPYAYVGSTDSRSYPYGISCYLSLLSERNRNSRFSKSCGKGNDE